MSSILKPRHYCWRIERADRAAVLVDGETCFRALRENILAARRFRAGLRARLLGEHLGLGAVIRKAVEAVQARYGRAG